MAPEESKDKSFEYFNKQDSDSSENYGPGDLQPNFAFKSFEAKIAPNRLSVKSLSRA